MLARNHEVSAFATTTLAAAIVGVPPVGALILGLLGGWAGDWPDIDHAGATATKSLRWVPYWRDHPRDKKTGDYKRLKSGKIKTEVRYFPSRQVHLFFCWLSATIYDRYATPADRRDTNQAWGPAFRVHRGFTHSIWCALLVGLAYWGLLAPWPVWGALEPIFGTSNVPFLVGCTVAVGMTAHIGGDACTDFGVSPFAPLIKIGDRRYPRLGLWEPMRFKVNKSVELLLVAPLCVVFAAYSVMGALFGPERVLVALWDFGSGLWTQLA